jgi:peptide/nickel transport system substrate-binding protein
MLNLPGSQRTSEISAIKSTTTQGNTVVLHLSKPFSPLLGRLADAGGMIVSPTAVDKEGDNFGANPVCSGPFMFKDRVGNDHITVVRSPYYWAPSKVHLDSIVFRPMADPTARTQALLAGDINVDEKVQGTDVSRLVATKNINVLRTFTMSYWGTVFNIGNKNGLGKPDQKVGTPLSLSSNLRRAWQAALDRRAINKIAYGGLYRTNCSPIPAVDPWYKVIMGPGFSCDERANVSLAQKLIRQSGYKTPITVHLMTRTDSLERRIGQLIQAMENKVGFNVVLQPTDLATAIQKAISGDFDVWQQGNSGRIDPDVTFFDSFSTQGQFNWGGYSNPRYDSLVRRAQQVVTEKARGALYRAAAKILMKDQPTAWFANYPVFTGVSKNVVGVTNTGIGQDFNVNFAGFRG